MDAKSDTETTLPHPHSASRLFLGAYCICKICQYLMVHVYVDDANIFQAIHTHGSRVQRDIDAFVEWSLANGLPLNTDKWAVILFTRSPAKVVFKYTIQGSLLSRVSSVRDLGVLFDDDFSFKYHIEAVFNKAIRALLALSIEQHSTPNICASIIYLCKSLNSSAIKRVMNRHFALPNVLEDVCWAVKLSEMERMIKIFVMLDFSKAFCFIKAIYYY